MEHQTYAALEAGLPDIRRSPSDEGRVELVVARPAVDERRVMEEGRLDVSEGLVGDNWRFKGSSSTVDGSAHPDKQLTLMNARFAALVAGPAERWALAGDQLYVDFDLSVEALPPGAQVEIGTALVEFTEPPHTGCAKFASRFGADALRFANSPEGRELRLRGANAKVVRGGIVRPGDAVRRVPGSGSDR